MGWDEMDDMDVTVARRELSLGNSHPATDTTLVVAIHFDQPRDQPGKQVYYTRAFYMYF